MTKELAIKILTGDVLGTSEQTQKAVTMAVKALSLPSVQPEPHYCRECKWSRCHINVDKHGKSETYWWCLNWDGGTDEEGYCYEWEKRTDD